jgi:hypothetical protein
VRVRGGLGEALSVWGVWAATLVLVVITYSRIDADELYHVHGNGIDLGLSRAAVHTNWPVALVAIVLVLVAMRSLPSRAWWLAGASIALCATMPLFVSQEHLNARWGNAIPAAGVALAFGLTVAAARRVGTSFEPRLPGDLVRAAIAVVVLVLSLPWIAAELGFHLPGGVFMGDELFPVGDGRFEAAVHLGEHHGWHGALLLLAGLGLSRVQADGRLGTVLLLATAALVGYGTMNAVQDFWNEQLFKRGTVDWTMPSALYPGAEGVTLATIVIAVVAAWLISRERAILRR